MNENQVEMYMNLGLSRERAIEMVEKITEKEASNKECEVNE